MTATITGPSKRFTQACRKDTDVSSFLGGNYLTHRDLPQPLQAWTISQANQQLVGTDQKICVTLAEFPSKPLGLNKTNLRRIADLYGIDATAWVGKPLQVYRSTTTYSGQTTLCVRVCGPQQVPPEGVCDKQGNAVAPQTPAAPAQQPVAAPQQNPWDAGIQQNSPPSA